MPDSDDASPSDGPTVACVSTLAEPHGLNVLQDTLLRLSRCQAVDATAVLCWQEQVDAVQRAADGLASVVPVGPQGQDPSLSLVARAQAWSHGWRGGPLATAPADRGWHAQATALVADATDAALVYAVDATFARLDVDLTDALILHAQEHRQPVSFTPAPPGLVGLCVRRDEVDRLAATSEPKHRHPGRALHYLPDAPRFDPVGESDSRNGPSWLTLATGDYRIDNDARLTWHRQMPDDLSLRHLIDSPPPERLDATLDVTTRRRTRPIWLADADDAELDVLPEVTGRRVTLGGGGDPMLHSSWPSLISRLRDGGATSIHVETDLLCDASDILSLLDADFVSVMLPAMTATTYRTVMRHDGLTTALGNLARLLAIGRTRPDGGPVVIPIFVKLAHNVAEMEPWYDQWHRAAGWAVVRGPDSFNFRPADDLSSLIAAPLNRTDRQPIGLLAQAA